MDMHKITPFLWFDDQAEAAARFYISVFANGSILSVTPGPGGRAQSISFELEGQRFIGLNAGPEFKFNEAISFFVSCRDQAEVDDLWAKLSAGGEESQCGWVKDRFGLWWQITPTALIEALSDPDPARAKRSLDAMLLMRKIDITALH